MLVLMIKALGAVVLTAIPFLFQVFVKPKKESSNKWKDFFHLMASLRPIRYLVKKLKNS